MTRVRTSWVLAAALLAAVGAPAVAVAGGDEWIVQDHFVSSRLANSDTIINFWIVHPNVDHFRDADNSIKQRNGKLTMTIRSGRGRRPRTNMVSYISRRLNFLAPGARPLRITVKGIAFAGSADAHPVFRLGLVSQARDLYSADDCLRAQVSPNGTVLLASKTDAPRQSYTHRLVSRNIRSRVGNITGFTLTLDPTYYKWRITGTRGSATFQGRLGLSARKWAHGGDAALVLGSQRVSTAVNQTAIVAIRSLTVQRLSH